MGSGEMAKKKTARRRKPAKPAVQDVEVTVVEEPIEEEEQEQQQEQPECEHDLTYTKRYTISLFNPEKSGVGCKVYDDVAETDKLADAKKQAQKLLEAENQIVAIWDRDWGTNPPIILEPPQEVKDDDDPEPTKPKKRRSNKPAPKPKHTRKRKTS